MEANSRACRWVRCRLPLLAGGDLPVDERRRVERHLIGCESCREQRDASARGFALLREVATLGRQPTPEPDTPSVWPALARQIRESRHLAPRPPLRHALVAGWLGQPRVLAGLGVAVAVGVLVMVGGGWPLRPASSTAPSTALTGEPRPAPAGSLTQPDAVVVEPNPATVPAPADDLRLPLVRQERRASALPDANPPAASTRPGVDPFLSPLTLRLDFDLDRGTLSGSTTQQDTQRAY